MENEATAKRDAEDFILAKVNGKFLRFAAVEAVPEGSSAITMADVRDMTKEKLGELYGSVAGVQPKSFKDKRVAIESLVYQVNKLPIYDPNSPMKAIPVATNGKVDKAQRAERKSAEVYELMSPPEVDKVLRELAPQARELVSIMTDIAKEKNSTQFTGGDLEEKLKIPEISARLRTKQDPMRILQYYKGKLIGSGLVRTK